MARDQYKYFRIEARELLEGLNQAVLDLERGDRGKDLVGRVLRLAHTLKGASRVVKQPGIAELAHSIEDVFAPYRDGLGTIPQACTNRTLGMLDMIADIVATLDSPSAETKGEPGRPVTEEFFETVRVEIEEMDTLLDGVSEASVQITALRREVPTLERAQPACWQFARKCCATTYGRRQGDWLERYCGQNPRNGGGTSQPHRAPQAQLCGGNRPGRN